jgi:hypothetical protein
LFNLHNHTPFSDGAYSIDELCEAHLALDCPVGGIGIADHLFATPSSHEIKSERAFERIFAKETRDYVALVRAAQERWDAKLPIFLGGEINWALNRPYVSQMLNLIGDLDYVMVENLDWAGLTMLANQSKRFPCPVILSHVNVRTDFPNTSLDQVVRTMANARLIYELNPKLMPFENDRAWYKILPQHRVRVAIGLDTHDDLRVLNKLPEIGAFVEDVGLSDKLFIPTTRDLEAAAS